MALKVNGTVNLVWYFYVEVGYRVVGASVNKVSLVEGFVIVKKILETS